MTIIYRILTYLLLPLGIIFSFFTFVALLASTANIAALLPTFLCGATVIYIITSLIFLQNGILGGKNCKPSLYDWIRVNGFVALFMGSMFIFQSIFLRGNAEMLDLVKAQMDTMAEQMNEDQKAKIPEMNELKEMVQWALDFMLITGVLMVAHIFIGFLQLRKYAKVFGR